MSTCVFGLTRGVQVCVTSIAAAKARAGALRAVPSAKTKAAAIKPAVRTAGSPSRLTRLFVIDSPTPFLLAANWRIGQLLL
jgi:hypothetical protein